MIESMAKRYKALQKESLHR